MKGRWTIRVCPKCGDQEASDPNGFGTCSNWTNHDRESPDLESVPVVPCDDAAIERVAVRLQARWGRYSWTVLDDEDRRYWLDEARETLREAAGLTP